MVKFNCAHCDTEIMVSDEYAGRKGKCPECNQVLVVPSPTAGHVATTKEPSANSAGEKGEVESLIEEMFQQEGIESRDRKRDFSNEHQSAITELFPCNIFLFRKAKGRTEERNSMYHR